MIIRDGRTKDTGPIIAPKIPNCLKPTYVAIFIPVGPGVLWAIATILPTSTAVYQPVFLPISYRNGRVARPPPTANKPVVKK